MFYILTMNLYWMTAVHWKSKPHWQIIKNITIRIFLHCVFETEILLSVQSYNIYAEIDISVIGQYWPIIYWSGSSSYSLSISIFSRSAMVYLCFIFSYHRKKDTVYPYSRKTLLFLLKSRDSIFHLKYQMGLSKWMVINLFSTWKVNPMTASMSVFLVLPPTSAVQKKKNPKNCNFSIIWHLCAPDCNQILKPPWQNWDFKTK